MALPRCFVLIRKNKYCNFYVHLTRWIISTGIHSTRIRLLYTHLDFWNNPKVTYLWFHLYEYFTRFVCFPFTCTLTFQPLQALHNAAVHAQYEDINDATSPPGSRRPSAIFPKGRLSQRKYYAVQEWAPATSASVVEAILSDAK